MVATRWMRPVAAALAAWLVAGTAPVNAAAPDPQAPLSSLVAVTQSFGNPIPEVVRRYVNQYTRGTLPASVVFPLPNATGDSVRTISNLSHNVVAKWFDPLSADTSVNAPRFGANADFVAYFGDGWDADWDGEVVGSAPQFKGSGSSGWLWVNHEYISNSSPTPTSAPTGQHLTLAKFLKDSGVLTNDVTASTWSQGDIDTHVLWSKRHHGGSWMRVQQDPATRQWRIVPDARSQRYDSTSSTLTTVVGHRLRFLDRTDDGMLLPPGIVSGIVGDCSGAQTPWGTVITAEENVQDYYGDLETAWSSSQRFVTGAGFDKGRPINPPYAASSAAEFGKMSGPGGDRARDNYGYLVEIDPGQPGDLFYLSAAALSGDGRGHRKVGSMGRAHWENATFAVGRDWRLVPGQPLVMYAGDDRRSGRIYKWVSREPYRAGMTRAEVRALLDEGSVWVAHFAGLDNTTGFTLKATGAPPSESQPGEGRWILLSLASRDVAPNAAALGSPAKTVGAALRDVNWNHLGGFTTDNDVRTALFTATNKIGVMELNRPEDIEWNAKDPSGKPRLYVAFTNHGRQVALDQEGVLYDPAVHAAQSPLRDDTVGSIFAIEEAAPATPATSYTFKYFAVWQGTAGTGPFDAANPDNLMLDNQGGVWFGTDGNFGKNGTADGLYYLNLERAHRAGQPGVVNASHGKAFRIVAGPADSEATGPAFSADQATIFWSAQHPGESIPSTWPQVR